MSHPLGGVGTPFGGIMRKFGPGASITRHKPVSIKKEEGSVAGAAVGAASGAISGASAGSSFGPVGTGIGAVIGGVSGGMSGYKASPEQTMQDATSVPEKAEQLKKTRELAAKAAKVRVAKRAAGKMAKAAKGTDKLSKGLDAMLKAKGAI